MVLTSGEGLLLLTQAQMTLFNNIKLFILKIKKPSVENAV
jgi:hypothetical protein